MTRLNQIAGQCLLCGAVSISVTLSAHGQSFFDPTTSSIHLGPVAVEGTGTFDTRFELDVTTGVMILRSADETSEPPNLNIEFDAISGELTTNFLAAGPDTYFARFQFNASSPDVQFTATDVRRTQNMGQQGSWEVNYSNSFPNDPIVFNTNGTGSVASFQGDWVYTENGQSNLDLGASTFTVTDYATPASGTWASGTFNHFSQQGTFTLTPTNTMPDLGMNADRFTASINWNDGQQSGSGNAVPLTDDSGGFYFFEPQNVDLLIRVLDGCNVNNNYWVFAASTSNVQFDLTVTDTTTGTSLMYSNSLGGSFQPIQDTSAFATCP